MTTTGSPGRAEGAERVQDMVRCTSASCRTAVDARPVATAKLPRGGGSRHLGLALAVISMAQLMLVLDELIVNTALPHIQAALHFSGTGLEWVVNAYAITFGGLLLLGGRSGDILGRRRMFILGILVFSLASLAGGFATRSWWLIASRATQGIGAAIAAPAALSLISVTFPEGRPRNRALGVYAAMTGVGGGVGVIAGGLLTTYASWRWVFFVNVPVGLLLAAGTRFVIPQSPRHPRHWDIPGAVLGTVGFASLIYGLNRAATGPDGISHWGDLLTVAALAVAAVALIAFVVAEARSPQPLLPLWIFKDRNRAGVYLMLVGFATAFFAFLFFLTLFLQTVWGYTPLRGGLAYLPFVIGFIVFAGICSQLITRVGPRLPMTIGAIIAPGAMFWLSRVHETSSYWTGVLPPLLVFSAAAGFVFVPLTTIVVAGISDEHAGVASSMFNAGQQVGGALGLAIIGSVTWTVVNNHIRNALSHLPAGHPVMLPGPGTPIYDHALSSGLTTALTLATAATVFALAVALIAIRAPREDLPARPAMA
jgi:EmrB/QacA subfamily drug resistance transporter